MTSHNYLLKIIHFHINVGACNIVKWKKSFCLSNSTLWSTHLLVCAAVYFLLKSCSLQIFSSRIIHCENSSSLLPCHLFLQVFHTCSSLMLLWNTRAEQISVQVIKLLQCHFISVPYNHVHLIDKLSVWHMPEKVTGSVFLPFTTSRKGWSIFWCVSISHL